MMKGTGAFLLTLCLSAVTTHAQQDSTARVLDEVVVTANRFAQKQSSTGKVLTVINRAVIERSLGMSVAELLNQQAGIAIAGANNNTGTNPDVYMRGAATGNTLILVDGVPMYDVATINNTFDLNHLPLEGIERIEILKGAQSTVYGSDAVAGVIHIITRKKDIKPVGGFGSVTTGSWGTLRSVAGLRGTGGPLSYQVQYQDNRSQGMSAAFDSSGKKDFDRDGFRQQTANASLSLALGKRFTLRGQGLTGDYVTGLDRSAFNDERDFTATNRNRQFGGGIDYIGKQVSIHANVQQGYLRRIYLDDSVHVGGFAKYSREQYEGRSGFAEVYGKVKLADRMDMLAGVDHRWFTTDQSFYSLSAWGPYTSELGADSARTTLTSAFVSLFARNDRGWFIEGGGRFNRHSRFGNHATFTINPSYVIAERWKLFANLSSAFKAPSLYQLFDGSVGEATLEPERSVTAEAGVQYGSSDGKINGRLVYFDRTIRNGIDFDYVSYRYFNYNRQQARGLEWEGSWRLGKWQLAHNHTWVRGQVNTTAYRYDASSWSYKSTGDTTYNNLFRRPEHQSNLSISWEPDARWMVRLSGRIVGMRLEPRFMDSPLELEAYKVADLYVSYAITDAIRCYFDLRNLTNHRYFDVAGFNARGRNFMTGVSWRF